MGAGHAVYSSAEGQGDPENAVADAVPSGLLVREAASARPGSSAAGGGGGVHTAGSQQLQGLCAQQELTPCVDLGEQQRAAAAAGSPSAQRVAGLGEAQLQGLTEPLVGEVQQRGSGQSSCSGMQPPQLWQGVRAASQGVAQGKEVPGGKRREQRRRHRRAQRFWVI